ncbi:MobF family relaxase [Acidithiobacillus sulfurivorans]|uniref:Relaxase domain-containing protein n=1 Tax=Acidithiobacillus sulfurivorans TaxID=1958756 RepID=A0ABS6A4V3_9PROT|nr:MobF family relaxase [Acidithiobacillus sulfurivorans]MBU2761718.1 relaxase domain-containing protein [Acidithiobacillus sulfurivorans]
MLSIKNVRSKNGKSGGMANYPEEGLTMKPGGENAPKKDGVLSYYQGAEDGHGIWFGTLAKEVEYPELVDHDAFVEALEGHFPGDLDISQRGHRQGDRRLCTDLTFSAPKSISLLALVENDRRILEVHHAAVREALRFIEKEVLTARMGKGGTRIQRTGKMLAATFKHEDARDVDGRIDPQLHTHCMVMNVTRREDDTLSAMVLDFGMNNVRMHLADAIYKNALARGVRTLGYGIERTKDGFEVAGIPPEAITRFSQRKAQIDAALESVGLSREHSTATQRTHANLATRRRKIPMDRVACRWEWRERVREAGLDLAALQRAAQGREDVLPDISADAVQSAARHLSERDTVFSRDAVRLTALQSAVGAIAGLDQVDDALTRSSALISVGADQLTTEAALLREQTILARVAMGQNRSSAFLEAAAADRLISDREAVQGFPYSAGQRAALQLGLTSTDQVLGVVGSAGTGKTTSMAGIVAAAQARGYQVVGLAPSAAASRELDSAGATDTRTLARYLLQPDPAEGPRYLLLDEAGMVSARDMELLLQRLRPQDRLLLVGDPRQLASVEAGNPFALLLDSGVLAHVRIEEVQRQRDPQLRRIAEAFAAGRATEAVAAAQPYLREVPILQSGQDRQGRPKVTTEDRQQAIAAACAADYLARNPVERERTLLVSGTNAVRARINTDIRAGLQAQGAIGPEAVTITALDKANLTREQRTLAEQYRPGMVVRIRRPRQGVRGKLEEQAYTVIGTQGGQVLLRDAAGAEMPWDPARADHSLVSLYQTRTLPLATGDRVLFRENQTQGEKTRIVNGQTGQVVAVDTRRGLVTIALEGQDMPLEVMADQVIALDYGWCRTIHASQGQTVNHVIVAGEASRLATAETAYVAASWERWSLVIYTDDQEKLQQSWTRWAERQSAMQATRTRMVPHLDTLTALRERAAAALGREGDLARVRVPEQKPMQRPAPDQQPQPPSRGFGPGR